MAVYTLSGDSARHPECTQANGCFTFWPPVKVASAKSVSRAAGVKGRLGTWRRDGFLQLTLNGHPLYTFSQDRQKDHATGEGLHTFGGTWHVSRAGGASTGSTGSQSQPPMTTGTTTTPTYPTY
jgi:predicted lipoprotein with Yx(FWY)xxD motif